MPGLPAKSIQILVQARLDITDGRLEELGLNLCIGLACDDLFGGADGQIDSSGTHFLDGVELGLLDRHIAA